MRGNKEENKKTRKIDRKKRGRREGGVHREECVRGTPARVTSGTQRSKSPWWFEKRETRKLRTFLMQKGSRSGAEVGRNNDGVPVEMIHPSNILGSRSSRGWRSNNRFALSRAPINELPVFSRETRGSD